MPHAAAGCGPLYRGLVSVFSLSSYRNALSFLAVATAPGLVTTHPRCRRSCNIIFMCRLLRTPFFCRTEGGPSGPLVSHSTAWLQL